MFTFKIITRDKHYPIVVTLFISRFSEIHLYILSSSGKFKDIPFIPIIYIRICPYYFQCRQQRVAPISPKNNPIITPAAVL